VTNFDKVIPPGSEGKIFAKVDPSHSEGAVQKFIDIKSNDPANPFMKLSIKATIKSLVNINPEFVRFDVRKGSLESADVILTPQPSVKLLKPVADSPLITVELVPEKGGKQKLTINMKQSDVIGTFSTEVKIPAEGPVKQVVVPVVIMVHGPLQVNPQIVSFQINSFPEVVSAKSAGGLRGEAKESAAVSQKIAAGAMLQVLGQAEGWYQVYPIPAVSTQQKGSNDPAGEVGWIPVSSTKTVKPPDFPEPQNVQIQSAGEKPFQVLDLRSTLPMVKIERKNKTQAKGIFEFTATLQKVQNAKKQHLQGEIIVKTDNADQPQIRIPLYVIFT